MKFLDIEGPLIQFLSRMADLIWLNILTVVCCLPIITAGASLTAMHYMVLKILRNEEGYITRGFFKAFKENFKQSTAIWLIFMLIFGVLFVDYRIVLTTNVEINGVVRFLIVVIAGLSIFTFMYVFPLQSKFSNTVKKTIQNAFWLSIMQFPKTILMIIFYALPYLLIYVLPGAVPIILVFCLTIPAMLSAMLYNKFFLKMEDQILARAMEGAEAQGEGGMDAGEEVAGTGILESGEGAAGSGILESGEGDAGTGILESGEGDAGTGILESGGGAAGAGILESGGADGSGILADEDNGEA